MKKILFSLIIITAFLVAVGRFDNTRNSLSAGRVEDIVRRTAVTCYSTRGFYPPDIEYMEKNYGLQVNREKFRIHYEIFASNIMPDITVVEVTG